MHATELYYTQEFSQPTNMQRYLNMVSWQKGKMASSEPLIQEADPHIMKARNRSLDVG